MGTLEIKGVTTRKEFEFITDGALYSLSGSFEKNANTGKLMSLSANVIDELGTHRGTVRGYVRGTDSTLLYDYNGMSSSTMAIVSTAMSELEQLVNNENADADSEKGGEA